MASSQIRLFCCWRSVQRVIFFFSFCWTLIQTFGNDVESCNNLRPGQYPFFLSNEYDTDTFCLFGRLLVRTLASNLIPNDTLYICVYSVLHTYTGGKVVTSSTGRRHELIHYEVPWCTTKGAVRDTALWSLRANEIIKMIRMDLCKMF